MMENGEFELIVDSKKQNVLYKTDSQIDGAYATVYLTDKQKPIWVCPPITVD